jgi:dihydrofolate reductase
VVTISSTAGIAVPGDFLTAYAASKFGADAVELFETKARTLLTPTAPCPPASPTTTHHEHAGCGTIGGAGVRKIVVYELSSLDGVAEDPDAFFPDWDDAMDAHLAAVIAAQDAVVLGRRSYTEWAQYWPGSQVQPFADFINGVTKYVATSTPLDRDWANATAVDGGLVDFVRDLKQQPGGDVGVHASISVAQALLAAGVVDELRLVIAPRIAGRGRRLLDGLPPIRLAPIRSELTPTGYLLVDYQVAGA